MTRRREIFLLCSIGLIVAAAAALGIGVRATYGAQTTADEPQYLLSALSIWEDGDLDISDELADQRYREFHEVDLPEQTLPLKDGRRVSPHDPLLPLLLAVPMGLGGWVVAKGALALLGGALAALTVWTARHRLGVSGRTAMLTTALFALAPPLVIYSTQVYPEIPAALALLAGFAAILGPLERPGRIVFVIAVIALPWLAVKYVPVAAVLALAGLIRARQGGRLALVAAFGLAALAYVVGHLLIYDGLTAYSTGDHFVGGEFTAVGTEVDLWGRSTRVIGLLADRGFGVAAWQPAFFLLPLVAGWAIARRGFEFVWAGWLLATGWLGATFVALTMHGWWFPGRQLVVVLPIAILMVAAWVGEKEATRTRWLAALGVLGVIAYGFLVAEGLGEHLTWVVDFGATANPAYRLLTLALPDYMTPTVATWVLHGVWVAVIVVLIWRGWAGASFRRDDPGTPELDRERSQERVWT